MDFISPEVKRQMQQNQANRQIEINASKMQLDSSAEQVAYYLYEEIRDYQNKLPDTEDVAMSIVQFNQSITILLKKSVALATIWFVSTERTHLANRWN